MATIPHESSQVAPKRQRRPELLMSRMWVSLAIAVIWLSVLFDAVFGPDIVTTSAGGDTSVIPSAVVVAVFAFFATWVIAKYGFRRESKE